jgi:hypothetical protein
VILGGNTPTVPAAEVARQLRCDRKTVTRALRRAGIEPLTTDEANRLRLPPEQKMHYAVSESKPSTPRCYTQDAPFITLDPHQVTCQRHSCCVPAARDRHP